MTRINKSQWGDIAQGRQDRLDAFSKDLAEVLKKHGMSIEQGEFVFFIEDAKTRDIIGEANSISAEHPGIDVYMNDYVEEPEQFELNQSEPIDHVCSAAQKLADEITRHMFQSQPLTDIEPGVTLRGILELVNTEEQKLGEQMKEEFHKMMSIGDVNKLGF